MQKKEITLQELHSAKSSINGRLKRLRTYRPSWRTFEACRRAGQMDEHGEIKTPIARLGVFDDEIDRVERAYEAIQSRLNNAKITIEI